MNLIPILSLIFGINFIIASDDWVTADDFSPSELANLTLQQEHELMLQKLATKKELIVARMIYREVLSVGFGYYFIGLSQNENTAQENNSIIRAMFECLTSLLIQDRVEELLLKIPLNGAQYARTYGNVSLAFSLICSDIDMVLKNETLYTTLRDKYRNESYSQPKHYYLNRIPKSSKEVITANEKLFLEPKMKQVVAHRSWISMKFSTNSKLTDIHNSIRKLAREQVKSEQVQKYYEQWIEEIIPMMRNTSMDTHGPSDRYWYSIYFPLNLIDRLWNSIIKNFDDWMDYLECRPTADEDFSADENTLHMRKRCRVMGVIEGKN